MDPLPLKEINLVMETANPTNKIKFQWSIRNVHKLPGLIRSSKFSLAPGQPCDWNVSIRCESDDTFEFSLTYHAQPDAAPIRVESCSRILKNGISVVVSDYQSTHLFNGGDEDILLNGVHFQNRSEDDKLVFHCSMTAQGYGLVCSRSLYSDDVDQEVDELRNDYLSMLTSEEFADVVILIGGRCFAAHRCVLKSLAPKFFGDHEEEILGGKIRLKKILPVVFEVVLRSTYSGEVGQIDKHLEQIHEVAFQYELGRLLKASTREVIRRMDMDSVCMFYVLSKNSGDEKLVDYCQAYLKDNVAKVQCDKSQDRPCRKRPKATRKKLLLLRNHFN